MYLQKQYRMHMTLKKLRPFRRVHRMSEIIESIPPQNIDAEKSTLGSMLLEKDAIFAAQEILKPEDFYREAHRHIFQAIAALSGRGEPVDLVTVAEELRQRNLLEQVGGASYLASL